jgi:hypothetical protein
MIVYSSVRVVCIMVINEKHERQLQMPPRMCSTVQTDRGGLQIQIKIHSVGPGNIGGVSGYFPSGTRLRNGNGTETLSCRKPFRKR